MEVTYKCMLCALAVLIGISYGHGKTIRRNSRKIKILERKLGTVIIELEYVKEELKEENLKTILENQLNALVVGKEVASFDNQGLKDKLDTVIMEFASVKEDLKEEKRKSIQFANQLNALLHDNKVALLKNQDSDLTEHHSVVHGQQEVGSVAMSVEQRIYNAMKDEKNLRKQFEEQIKNDFRTANNHTEIKFTTLTETLSAVIDRKLDIIEDNVSASVTVLNEASSFMANLTLKLQRNDEAITSLMLDSEQLNTTLLRHGIKLETIENDIANNVKQNNEYITNLKIKSDQLNTTLLRQGTKLETIEVDLANNVQQNDEYITNLKTASDQLNTTLFRHGTKLETIEVDLANKVEKLIDNSHRYKVCLHGGKHLEDGMCDCVWPYYGYHCEKVYNDCYDIHNQTDKPTGVYTVKPRGLNETIQVQCDMITEEGGWTVFQYRYDGSLDFYRNFDAYENGFGNMTGELWLGLRYIHAMTSSTPSLLRFDLEAADGTTAYQQFDNFSLSEGPDYIPQIGTSAGTAGDSRYGLSYNKGSRFSTYDRDVDRLGGGNCAVDYHGAWWYSDCTLVNLNGEYAPPGTRSTITYGMGGMIYYNFKKKESLKSSKMMFRRK